LTSIKFSKTELLKEVDGFKNAMNEAKEYVNMNGGMVEVRDKSDITNIRIVKLSKTGLVVSNRKLNPIF
jgi:hypothetical protein